MKIMRKRIVAVFSAAGFGVIVAATGASAIPANNTAMVRSGLQNEHVIPVLGNCGRGMHRNRWGACRPGCGWGWFQPYAGAHCRRR